MCIYIYIYIHITMSISITAGPPRTTAVLPAFGGQAAQLQEVVHIYIYEYVYIYIYI